MAENGLDEHEQDRDFERTLERLYCQTPALGGADAFVGGVEARLARNWRLRTFGIGAAGIVGGVIAASQIIGSGLALRVEHASTQSARAVDTLYHGASVGMDALSQISPSAGLFWVVSGLMILAAVIGATRVLDEV
jgi:hypothetical protein